MLFMWITKYHNPPHLVFQLMDLKGQMIYVPESNAILFLGSPCVDKLEELTGRGLYLSDIPIHNALRDVVLVGEQAKAQDGLKKRLGKAKAALERAHQALEEEKKKTVDLLFSIFPGTVAQQLWQGQTVQAKKFERVTMLFSDIVGFTAVCSRCTPMQVITMLNELYTRFDHHCGELDVYKVGEGWESRRFSSNRFICISKSCRCFRSTWMISEEHFQTEAPRTTLQCSTHLKKTKRKRINQ